MATKFNVTDPIAPITCHAWNKDRTMLAIAPNNEQVHIMKFDGKTFTKIHELNEHGSRVTGLDWAPNSNRIATCGEDRNAYVWNLEGNEWKPTLVILRINRAATCVKWSPKEDKFAVGSGSRLISICYFESENDWWVSKHIKKPIRSTVVSLDWHPNNVLVAAGSTDFKARVFSGYIKGLDPKPEPTPWGKKMTFGALMGEYNSGTGAGGWVHGVSFDATGGKLAFVAHDSTITVVDKAAESEPMVVLSKHLPYRCVSFVSDTKVVAAGHDNIPYIYEISGSELVQTSQLDVPAKKELGRRLTAMDKFRSMDSKGTADAAVTDTTLKTTHQNSINEISLFKGSKENVQTVCSVGVDGMLCLWEMTKAGTA